MIHHALQAVVVVIELHLVGWDGEVIGEVERTMDGDTAPRTVAINALWCGESAQALSCAVRYQPTVGCLSLTALGHLLR